MNTQYKIKKLAPSAHNVLYRGEIIGQAITHDGALVMIQEHKKRQADDSIPWFLTPQAS